MAGLVWLNGTLVAPEAARVSLFDRGYLLGDSVFATVRASAGRPFRLAAHLDGLAHGAAALGIPLGLAGPALAAVVRDTLAASGLAEAAIRVTLSRGEGPGGIATAACASPTLSVAVRPFVPYPADAYAHGIATAIVPVRKVPAECLDPALKTGNYLPNVLGRRTLEARGLLEGVMLSLAGAPVSGLVSNLFVVSGGRLATPDLASGCRPGVTRAAVLELARALGMPADETALPLGALLAADEMFFTNALMEILPVARLDGHGFGPAPGPVTRRLMAAFRDLVAAEVAD